MKKEKSAQDAEFHKYLKYELGREKSVKKANVGLIIFICIASFALLVSLGIIVSSCLGYNANPTEKSVNSETEQLSDEIVPTDNENNSFIPAIHHKSVSEDYTATRISEKFGSCVVAVKEICDGEEVSDFSAIVLGVDDNNKKTYFLTCAHGIRNGSDYKIINSDGDEYEAFIVGTDVKSDTAVLSVKKVGFTPADFCTKADVEKGESVVAIGNYSGPGAINSVTQGVVSNTKVKVESGEEGYRFYGIQHDAAINPGSSGGPLFNMQGQVIGMNSAKMVSEYYEGVGYSIPADTALRIAGELINNGKVERAKLDITYTQASEEYIKKYNLPKGSLKIAEIGKNSDLKGKAKAGDIITAANDEKLDDSDLLLDLIDSSKKGDEIKLKILRVDKKSKKPREFEISVKLV